MTRPNAAQLDTKLDFLKDRMKKIVDLSLERVVAHNEKPQDYPLPAESKSLERALNKMFKALPKKNQKRVIEAVNKTLKAPADQRKRIYGDLAEVNFRSSVSMVEQAKIKPVPSALKFTETDLNEIRGKLKRNPVKPPKLRQPAQVAEATEMSFIVNNLTCNKPSDLRKDEVSLAGFAVDNLGAELELAPFFVGDFKKGDTLALGGNGRVFNFKLTEGEFPKTFIAGLLLVEKDLLRNSDFVTGLIQFCLIASAALMAITVGMFIVAVAGGPASAALFIGALAASMLLGMSSLILAKMLDDFSTVAVDTLTFDAPVPPGTTFGRTFSFEFGIFGIGERLGKYEAAATWVTA
jgi:hypothetical protein